MFSSIIAYISIVVGISFLPNGGAASNVVLREYITSKRVDMNRILQLKDLGLEEQFSQDASPQIRTAALDAITRSFNFSGVPVLTCDNTVVTDKLFDPTTGLLRRKRQIGTCPKDSCIDAPVPVCNITRRLSKPLFGYNPNGEFRVIVQMPTLEQCVEIIHCSSNTCNLVKGRCQLDYRLEQLMVFDPIQDIPFSDYIFVPSGCTCRVRISTLK
ncbi:PREDICTED: uncharacterized protein LOC106813096 [Priapulus caudatus]|uniref:Uncharacterized protein LOC106813096 n=1 Tax=Priapulus caudatus TaxID=37621 RepID=A0ABM1EKM3_PRICU|nr:PREDICTED: uncharacterized protein LOC106813096 [Priapulus caudatus]XP_014672744.1 PREDICTED: uncharacterized protein LOC106813096 [Priapulus caudatus]